jgi:thiamine-phosphate pyrophosphorylase
MHKKFPSIFAFLDNYNSQAFTNNITNMGIIYRNYNSNKREHELAKVALACKINKCQLFVSNDIKLALKYGAKGIYIPSFNKTKKILNFEKKNFLILGSAHNQKEISEKISQNCDGIFLSPIFDVKNKKKKLGTHKFNYLTLQNKTTFFALGGISEINLNKLSLLNIKGFAGIRLFKKKPAFKKAGFIKNKFFLNN